MMAFDRSPTRPALDADTTAQLRAALERSLQDGSHSDGLKPLLARAAVEARERGLQAEQLLLALKDIWYSLPQLSVHPADETQTRLLQQLIARCIKEYYAS